MFIEVADLEAHPLVFDERLAPGAIDLGPDFVQRAALEASGSAELVEEHHSKREVIQDIRLRGKLNTRLEAACARCLDAVSHEVKRSFDLLYRPQGVDAGQEELSITDVEAEIGYYQNGGILLEDVLREQILLSAPVKTICREDCKGLCPHCGKNLNLEQCSCAEPLEDPRWAALKEIRNKLEH